MNGVSLEIRDGETVAIVGESGCGKSTIARMILRLERPTSGAIRLGGEDLLAMEDTTAARRAVQLVSQNPWSALNRRKTVKHTLTQPLKVHGLIHNRAERTQRAAHLLSGVGLSPDYLYRYPSGISGGELQRVTIARALAVSPQVLILDEPTASLDRERQGQHHQPADRAPGGGEPDLPVHHPRDRYRQAHQRSDRGDVSRTDRRTGTPRKRYSRTRSIPTPSRCWPPFLPPIRCSAPVWSRSPVRFRPPSTCPRGAPSTPAARTCSSAAPRRYPSCPSSDRTASPPAIWWRRGRAAKP